MIKKKGKNTAAKPAKVLLPCDPVQRPVPYQGRAAIGSILNIEGKPAVVALAPNDLKHRFSEGYIYVPDDRMELTRKKGDKIGICRKVQMQPFFWGCEYYVVDRSRKGVLCTIHPHMKKQGSIILKFNNKKYRPRMPRTKSIHGFFLVEPVMGWPKD